MDKSAMSVRKGKEKTQIKNERQVRERRRAVAKESARSKAQYDNLSLRWQEKLLNTITADMLKQAARYITPNDYDSIISERCSGDMCGYPICDRQPKSITQKFHISLSRRKLYDISEQSNYCSNVCYVGSQFYKQQLSEEPLYLRDRSKELDVEILPSSGTKENIVPPPNIPPQKNKPQKKEDLAAWYLQSQMEKMKITDEIAASNPLKIVEHEMSTPKFDIDERMGKLQFADVEGFEPEIGIKRIKDAIRRTAKHKPIAGRNGMAMDVVSESSGQGSPVIKDNESMASSSAGLMDMDTERDEEAENEGNDGGSGVDEMYGYSNTADMLAPPSGSSDDDDDDDEKDNEDTDGNHYFECVYGINGKHSHKSRGAVSMSFFGRMWSLFDKITSSKTRRYLADLSVSQNASLLLHRAIEYNIAPGDKTMAIRHDILCSGVLQELRYLQSTLKIEVSFEHEVRLLVSTLLLNESMSVFNEAENRLICLVFLLAIARTTNTTQMVIEKPGTLHRLNELLEGLRVQKCELDMVVRRLFESY